MPASVSGSTRLDDIERKYDVVLNFPNLELHSAAAEGNVGLVHYALTHGQPVNSVLHGVQPIHAAAAGGSISAVKMLIDRGADVNAPRLPRRYSNEKKKGAPSLGAAAANGHAEIVQILLTCGARSNKADKLGQTPASLAEANGHDDVLHVLKVYDHLKRQDSMAGDTASIASTSMFTGPFSDGGSPSQSTVNLEEEDYRPSRKGKERAMSIVSTRSDASGIIKLRKSLDGLLGRRSRKNSLSMEPMEDVPAVPPLPASPLTTEVLNPDDHPDDGLLRPPPLQYDSTSRPTTPDGLPYPPSLAPSSVYHSPMGGNSAASSHTHLATIPAEQDGSTSIEQAAPANDADLARVLSGGSQASAVSAQSSTFASVRSGINFRPAREHRTSHSSRRPSLPSIFEKAAHPGQTFRNVLHRREQADQTRPPTDGSTDGESPRSFSGNSFFGRGRNRNVAQPSPAAGAGEPSQLPVHDKGRKSRNAFIGLFRRTNSPPSRSPSPPNRRESRPIDAQELEEGIERFRRASLEMDRQERRSLDEVRDPPLPTRQMPNSAPAIKTRFFKDLSPSPPIIPNSAFVAGRPEVRTSPISPTGGNERPWNRPRKGSNVIAPSPLAKEWARESSDSDSTVPTGIRRAKTEGGANGRGPSRLSVTTATPPGSLRANKQRSATLPSTSTPASPTSILGPARNVSTSRLLELGLDERADLRSGVLRRESERKRGVHGEDGAEDAEDEEEDEEVFHDAQDDVESPPEGIEILTGAEDERQSEKRAEGEAKGSEPELSPSLPTAIRNRFRGASIGSMTSQSSRLSTPNSSIIRYGSNPSDDSISDRHVRLRGLSDHKHKPPPPPPSSISGDSRPRGKSVSSISTTASGSGPFSSYNQSTSATSLTPPSTLSITLGSAFPPVPEDDVTDGSPSSIPPLPHRKFSSRAEAAKAIKQQEDDMLQLAQLPLNADSSRDLAAQLAAYGESHVIEQELAQIERRERKHARKTGAGGGKGKFEIPNDTSSGSRSTSEVSSSFVSAQSAPSNPSAPGSVVSSGMRSDSVASSRRRGAAPSSMISVEAPKTSVPNISSIYDRRATLYREKMQALTATPALHAPSSPHASERPTRQRAVTNHLPGPPAWLTGVQPGGSSSSRPGGLTEISSSLPAGSLAVQPPGQGIMAGAATPKPPRSRKASFNSIRVPPSPAPPIADIVNTRYQGLSSVASYPRSSNTLYSVASSRTGTNRGFSSPLPSSSSQIQPAPAPAVSIFSHRYAGPHDGGESDDSEGEQRGYTMVENDFGRNKMLATGDLGAEGLARKGKWGFRGPFGKKK